MSQALIYYSNRLRCTLFSRRVEVAGAISCNIYNRTLWATACRSIEEDCTHLKSAVQVWDVTCEKQVEIIGPEACRPVQMTTLRDLAEMQGD